MTTETELAAGMHRLRLGGARDGVVYVPEAAADGPVPLIVLCHGAGGAGADVLRYVAGDPVSVPAAILAPDSVGRTWDAIDKQHQSVVDVLLGARRVIQQLACEARDDQPTAALMAAMTMLSMNSCSTSCNRDAPMERRTASSLAWLRQYSRWQKT